MPARKRADAVEFVYYLEETGQIDKDEENRHSYGHVFDTSPGEQMLFDFREITFDLKVSIHFICLLHAIRGSSAFRPRTINTMPPKYARLSTGASARLLGNLCPVHCSELIRIPFPPEKKYFEPKKVIFAHKSVCQGNINIPQSAKSV